MNAEAPAPLGTLAAALARTRDLLIHAPHLAEEQAGEILKVVPDQPDALLLRGQALAALGRPHDAIAALRRAATRSPESVEAWRTLADQLVLVGDGPGADAAFAQQIRTSVRDPRLRQAAIALCDNDLPVAERLLRTHLKAHPTDIAAIRMLAELAGRLGRYGDAELLLRRAVELAPGFAPARFNLATVLYRDNRVPEALALLERLMEDEPANIAYRNLVAAALAKIGDLEDAIAHFERVLRQSPNHPKIWMSYGHSLKTVGRQADSVDAYRRAIARQPTLGEAWWSLANLKTVKLSDADVAEMETALAADELGAEDRFHLHFALGKALEDLDRPGPAFAHYAEGNRLRRATAPHDPDLIHARVERARAFFTADFFAARRGLGCQAADPIFVLGMPRAGSTLIEQILASHSAVEGTQELHDIQRLARQVAGDGDRDYLSALAALDGDALRALGEQYLEATRIQRKTDKPFFVDKMPNNWAHIGLIQLILPNARIVDARRHPLGCCFSNFKQHFARGQAFSYSLEDLGRYYADYVALMDHFDAVLPGRIHRVFYERMVEDTENEVRRLLAYLDLPFEPACLRFHETERAVRTASSEQVRRPIFHDGIDQWQRFAPWLGALTQSLGAVIDNYPYLSPPAAAPQQTPA